MGKGKLIVIDGLDGSGKQTQTKLLLEALSHTGHPVRQISFPTYGKSSALIELYLSGAFGGHAGDVNPYAASTFFTVDRVASYLGDWRADYEAGTLIVADRYTTSNAIHQAAKLSTEQKRAFFAWLDDFEYEKVKLPRPDAVFFLDLPPALGQELMARRYHGDERKKDVHERDFAYLEQCYETAQLAARELGWQRIECSGKGEIKSVQEIHLELVTRVKEICGIL